MVVDQYAKKRWKMRDGDVDDFISDKWTDRQPEDQKLWAGRILQSEEKNNGLAAWCREQHR